MLVVVVVLEAELMFGKFIKLLTGGAIDGCGLEPGKGPGIGALGLVVGGGDRLTSRFLPWSWALDLALVCLTWVSTLRWEPKIVFSQLGQSWLLGFTSLVLAQDLMAHLMMMEVKEVEVGDLTVVVIDFTFGV